jgi:hypothetical protein
MKKPTLDEAKYLLEYRQLLEDQKNSLRQEACQLARKIRDIDKILSNDIIQEVKNQEIVEDQYQVKSLDQLKKLNRS